MKQTGNEKIIHGFWCGIIEKKYLIESLKEKQNN